MSEGTRPAAVLVEDVDKIFNVGSSDQVHALSDVDLSIADGEFITLIGPSGCGKSTLLRLMADLIEPTSGRVSIFGKSASQARLEGDYAIAIYDALKEDLFLARDHIGFRPLYYVLTDEYFAFSTEIIPLPSPMAADSRLIAIAAATTCVA